MLRASFAIIGCCALLAANGCGSSEPTGSGGGPPFAGPDAMKGSMMGPPSGNAVFDKNCTGCHQVMTGAAPGGPPRKGPNLAKVGAEHKADWIADYVKNPAKVKADSKMPEFASKLSADDIKSVSEFLAEKK